MCDNSKQYMLVSKEHPTRDVCDVICEVSFKKDFWLSDCVDVETEYDLTNKPEWYVELVDYKVLSLTPSKPFSNTINSIVRTSDGEVFNVNDGVNTPHADNINIDAIILVTDNTLEVYSDCVYYEIKDLEKPMDKPIIKQFILITKGFIGRQRGEIAHLYTNGLYVWFDNEEVPPGYKLNGDYSHWFKPLVDIEVISLNKNNNHPQITSIRRLSDGEIFKVDDRIDGGSLEGVYINSFELSLNNEIVAVNDGVPININDIVKNTDDNAIKYSYNDITYFLSALYQDDSITVGQYNEIKEKFKAWRLAK